MYNNSTVVLVLLTIMISGECPDLQDIANGAVNYTSWQEGAAATYSCSGEYTLQGTRIRTCVNGQWSGQEPRCKIHSINMISNNVNNNDLQVLLCVWCYKIYQMEL